MAKKKLPPEFTRIEAADVVKFNIGEGVFMGEDGGKPEYAVSIKMDLSENATLAMFTLGVDQVIPFCKALMATAARARARNGESPESKPMSTADRLKAARRAREANARKPK